MIKYTELLSNPLAQGGRGNYLRLVLAEAAKFGMPADTIVMLDDIAAMMGFYDPMPASQANHLAGPIAVWRTHPQQPTFERITDIESLAYKQRCLIAFGGAPPGQMVGTAEIVIAMGNLIKGTSPPEYWELYNWASIDVLQKITGETEEEILAHKNKKDWKHVDDDEVLKPGGRLHVAYQEVCTSIRRFTIAAMEKRASNPRVLMRPLAAHYVEGHRKMLKELGDGQARSEFAGEHRTELMSELDDRLARIQKMYPDLGTVQEEIARYGRNAEEALGSE